VGSYLVSLRKTLSLREVEAMTNEVSDLLTIPTAPSGLSKAFLYNRLGNQQGLLRRLQKLPRYSKQLRGYTCDANLRVQE